MSGVRWKFLMTFHQPAIVGIYFLPQPRGFFSTTPGVNLATFRAAILMTPPVCGLRPLRALRCETEKVPNPTRVTRSPFFRAAVTASIIVSIAPPEAVLLIPWAAAIFSTKSPLFMLAPRQVRTCGASIYLRNRSNVKKNLENMRFFNGATRQSRFQVVGVLQWGGKESPKGDTIVAQDVSPGSAL